MNSKGFWFSLMLGTILLWGAAVLAGFLIWPGGGITSWYFAFGLAGIHLLEIPFVLKLLSDKDMGKGTIAVKTFIFGFTWWLPVKKGILPG